MKNIKPINETSDAIYWLWLCGIEGVGIKTAHKLLSVFESPKEIYECDDGAIFSKLIGEKKAKKVLHSRSLEGAKAIYDECAKEHIFLFSYRSGYLPERLLYSDDAPILLFGKGTLKDPGKTAGVIGARRCCSDNKNETIEITTELVKKGYTIVSGLAKGIDAYAHTAALKNDGYTLAFIASGCDICYPREHTGLMREIVEHGALLSEYPPGTRPKTYYFPARNRLIAGWSDELFVIAAGRNSGTGITVDHFTKYHHKTKAELIDEGKLRYVSCEPPANPDM